MKKRDDKALNLEGERWLFSGKNSLKLILFFGVFIGMIYFVLANPNIDFVDPTPNDLESTSNNSVEINISGVVEGLRDLTYNWNGTNYTFYDNNLILMYNFDNVSSLGENDTHIVDLAGGNNASRSTSGAVFNSSGKYESSLDFDGSGDFVINNPDSELSLGNHDFTMEAWIKLEVNPEKNHMILGNDFTAGGWQWQLFDGVNTLRFESGSSNIANASTEISINTWNHLAIVYDSSTDNVNFYLNGVDDGSDTLPQKISGASGPFYIGSNGVDGTGFEFNGNMDEIRVWNTTFTGSEISQHYMSNLRKFNETRWLLYVNQSKNATASLDIGTYTFQSSITNETGYTNSTEERTITIVQGDDSPSVTLVSPSNASEITESNSSFEVNATDDFNLKNATLHLWNSSGSLIATNSTNWTGTSNSTTFAHNFTDYGTYTWNVLVYDNNSQSSWATSNYTVSYIESTININYPSQYVVFQRDNSTTGEIIIFGNYTGAPTSIEAQFNDGGWKEINSSPSGSSFTGRLNASVGNGTLEVRFGNVVGVTDSQIDIGIGDVFVIGGQSNMEGAANNAQSLNSSNEYLATAYRQDDSWVLANDPVDTGTNQGSVLPLIADKVIQNQSIPISFITTAEGGTSILEWIKGASDYDTMFSQISEATNGTMKVKSLLFFQGERDSDDSGAGCNGNYTCYINNLTQMSNDFISDTLVAETVMVGQVHIKIDGTRSTNDNIKDAQRDSWDIENNISAGPVTYDIGPLSDDLHFKTDSELQEFADRWWSSIGSFIYSTGDGRGPILNNVTMDSGDNDTLILNFTEDSLPLKIESWNGTSSSLAEGFSFYLENGTFFNNSHISSTEVINQNQLRINFTINLTLGAKISLGSFNDAEGKAIVMDSSTYALPAEPFYNQTIVSSDSISPTITIHSPTNTSYTTSTIFFNATANEAIDTWIINYNGTNVTGFSINTSLTVEDGDHDLIIYGNDSSGNMGVNNTISFSVDTSTSPSSSDSSSSSSGGSAGVTHRPSNENLKKGYKKLIQEKNKVEITSSDGGKVQVDIDEITKGEEKVYFSINENKYSVKTNESVKIDTNNDGFYDLEVQVNEVRNSVFADMTFREIHEEVPSEQEEGVGEEQAEEIKGWFDENKNLIYIVGGVVILTTLYLIMRGLVLKLRRKK